MCRFGSAAPKKTREPMVMRQSRSQGVLQALMAAAIMAALFIAHDLAPAEPVLFQLWPVALLPLYRLRTRFVLEGALASAILLLAIAAWRGGDDASFAHAVVA